MRTPLLTRLPKLLAMPLLLLATPLLPRAMPLLRPKVRLLKVRLLKVPLLPRRLLSNLHREFRTVVTGRPDSHRRIPVASRSMLRKSSAH